MAKYSYMIPRDTKGEGKILMIFSKKSFIWTVICAAIGLVTIYPICAIFGASLIGMVGVLLFGLIGFVISSASYIYVSTPDGIGSYIDASIKSKLSILLYGDHSCSIPLLFMSYVARDTASMS